eukprot:4663050-Amphidinium_carterae.1
MDDLLQAQTEAFERLLLNHAWLRMSKTCAVLSMIATIFVGCSIVAKTRALAIVVTGPHMIGSTFTHVKIIVREARVCCSRLSARSFRGRKRDDYVMWTVLPLNQHTHHVVVNRKNIILQAGCVDFNVAYFGVGSAMNYDQHTVFVHNIMDQCARALGDIVGTAYASPKHAQRDGYLRVVHSMSAQATNHGSASDPYDLPDDDDLPDEGYQAQINN